MFDLICFLRSSVLRKESGKTASGEDSKQSDERTETADTNSAKKSATGIVRAIKNAKEVATIIHLSRKHKSMTLKQETATAQAEAAVLSLINEKSISAMKQSSKIVELLKKNNIVPEHVYQVLSKDKVYQSCNFV